MGWARRLSAAVASKHPANPPVEKDPSRRPAHANKAAGGRAGVVLLRGPGLSGRWISAGPSSSTSALIGFGAHLSNSDGECDT